MADEYKYALAGNERYATYGDESKRTKVWMVKHIDHFGTRQTVAAFFREDLARAFMAAHVQPGYGSVALNMIEVLDIHPDVTT